MKVKPLSLNLLRTEPVGTASSIDPGHAGDLPYSGRISEADLTCTGGGCSASALRAFEAGRL
jgi:hypothetical protein